MRLYRNGNVPLYMGGRIQEIARLRTMEFLIEHVIVLGAGHREIAERLNGVLITIRESLADLPADDDDLV